ncbi:MAG: PQQ-binding-like beta-propeller repeat protein [Planctomycetota bacterium]|nr:PQQ-binding-like beta-propeller repeat protein [Planctomycetota bacterium]
MKTFALLPALFFVFPAAIHSADWPAWRGTSGQGYCEESKVPLTWSETENVKWKVPLEQQGNSTPIVLGNRIFITQATTGGAIRSLLCLSRKDGKLLWQKDVSYSEKERSWNKNWYCNASPVTDGERVLVSFASAGMYCYDFDGKELWKRTDLGTWDHGFGSGSSPILYGDTAILWCGPNEKTGRNFLLSVKKATGETVWEHDEKLGSWGTPLIIQSGGKDQLLLSTQPSLKGLDPKTGKELWSCDGHDKYVYTSPLFGKDVVVAMTGYTGQAFAVKLGGTGDITGDRLWLHKKNIQRVGSGIIVGDHVYILEENGVPHCYDLLTGEEVWKVEKRPNGGNTWGSMVHVNGRLYVMTKKAITLVFAANPKYELLATNTLGNGDSTNSTPVISNGEVFLRTFKHLYCIAEK